MCSIIYIVSYDIILYHTERESGRGALPKHRATTPDKAARSARGRSRNDARRDFVLDESPGKCGLASLWLLMFDPWDRAPVTIARFLIRVVALIAPQVSCVVCVCVRFLYVVAIRVRFLSAPRCRRLINASLPCASRY